MFNFLNLAFNAQTVEFRGKVENSQGLNDKNDYNYNKHKDNFSKNELPPIVTSFSKRKESVNVLVYYDEATNTSVYAKTVKPEEKMGKLAKKLLGEEPTKYTEYKGVFNYKVTLNGTAIYDGPSPNSDIHHVDNSIPGIEEFEKENYFFDYCRKKTYEGKYGFYTKVSFFELAEGTNNVNLIKVGNNEFKMQVSYEGKIIGENSISYVQVPFQLTYDEGCYDFFKRISSTQHKSETAWYTKIINEKYADAFDKSGAKLLSVNSISNDWSIIKDDWGNILRCEKEVLLFVIDAKGTYYNVGRTFFREYTGGGKYSDVVQLSYANNGTFTWHDKLDDFRVIHSACFELVKEKYGVNK